VAAPVELEERERACGLGDDQAEQVEKTAEAEDDRLRETAFDRPKASTSSESGPSRNTRYCSAPTRMPSTAKITPT
jgi:hypothetical protein